MSYSTGQAPGSRLGKRGTLCRRDRRNTTGCIGVSLYSKTIRLATGPVTRSFYKAYLGGRDRHFPVASLGRTEAYRRAVQARAAYERQVSAAKCSVLSAQSSHHQP